MTLEIRCGLTCVTAAKTSMTIDTDTCTSLHTLSLCRSSMSLSAKCSYWFQIKFDEIVIGMSCMVKQVMQNER